MGPLLSSFPGVGNPRLKVGWAKHHLSLLEKEIHGFLNRPPYTVLRKDDLERREHRISLIVDPIPSTIVLMLGDFIHCLRCSLDQLATQLTFMSAGTPNPKASFPIMAIDNADSRRTFASQVSGIPGPAITEIKALQPYHAGNLAETTKLWQLHRLWNIDKHRRIPVHSTAAELKVNHPPDVVPFSRGENNSGVASFPLSAKNDVHVDPTIEISIYFGDEIEGIVVAPLDLFRIYQFVDQEVFPRFESFFQS